MTFAPSVFSHSVSQLPLNPVSPVIRTDRPRQKSGEGFTKPSKAPDLSPKGFRGGFYPSAYPSPAKNLHADRQRAPPRERALPSARAPKSWNRLQCSPVLLVRAQKNLRLY